MKIEKACAHIGVYLTGINLNHPIEDKMRQYLVSLYNEHQLLILRDQTVSLTNFFNFAKIFGEPERSISKFPHPENPLICIMSNETRNGVKLGTEVQPLLWHSDSYVKDNPNKSTLLHCIKAPTTGGETLFVNTYAAYETLPLGIQQAIEGKKIIYKHIDLTQPPLTHPIVRRNPVDGRKCLFVNIHNALGVEGLETKEGMELVRYLYEHVIDKQEIFAHRWQVNDVVIWDNPSTMHAPAMKHSGEPRTFYRIITKGVLPVS